MAINKEFSTRFGIDATHHIIQKLDINRINSNFEVLICGYSSSNSFNSGYSQLIYNEYTFTFSQLPAPILTKIQELKSAIEIEMINNLAKWNGGIQVNDNGS